MFRPGLISDLLSSLPPKPDYRYFNQGAPMFEREEHGFEAVNAAWMADAALLAYSDQDFASGIITRAGMQYYAFVQAPMNTQAHVFGFPESVVVAFRGTQVIKPRFNFLDILENLGADARTKVDSIIDVGVDFDASFVPWPRGGFVHKGIANALDGAWKGIAAGIEAAKADNGGKEPRVWFTGHSLGAALATLAANRHEHSETLYTFGSPRVGDAEFCQSHAGRFQTWRIVHNRDVVARVPLQTLDGSAYEHVETSMFIDAAGRVRMPLSDLEKGSLPPGKFFEPTRDFLHRQFEHGPLETIEGFIDHGPASYADKLWKAAS